MSNETKNEKKIRKLIKKIELHYEMELITGLHIGEGNDNQEIGGIDNPVIRAKLKDNQPYIPGSSLKGKLRSLLEISKGKDLGKDPDVNKLFGTGASDENFEPSRIIVRDAYLTTESTKALSEADLDMPFTEEKSENSINRSKGTAENPRKTERIPAGAKFDVHFLINIYEDDDERDLIDLLDNAIKLLEKDYLGGSGTRGYGQVKFNKKSQKTIEIKWNNNNLELTEL